MANRVEELKGLKWGMFVCWSFSTFSGKEWTPGVKDVAFFNANGCDTDQWARTAKEAGMGYILFLTKHHDGFCLWDTKTTDRKVTKSPLGRDVLAELRKSCDKYGIKLALYFSEGDWTWPGAVDGEGGNGSGKNPETEEGATEGTLHAIRADRVLLVGSRRRRWRVEPPGNTGLGQEFQPGCFVGFNSGEAGDLRTGEMGRPGRTVAAADTLIGRVHLSDSPPAQGRRDMVLFVAQARQPLPIRPKRSTGTISAR